MKCKLLLIHGNWFAENLGESTHLEPYNFLNEGELYRVADHGRFTPAEDKEVYVKVFSNPHTGDIPCEELQFECKIISLAKHILNETPPEVREKAKANALLEQNLGSRINTLQALFDRFIEKAKEQPIDEAFQSTQIIVDALNQELWKTNS